MRTLLLLLVLVLLLLTGQADAWRKRGSKDIWRKLRSRLSRWKWVLRGLKPKKPATPPNRPLTRPGRGIYPSEMREKYAPVVEALVEVFQEQEPEFRATTVSMSWHTLAAFRKDLPRGGGPTGGCMRMNPTLGLKANTGLDEIVEEFEPVKKRFPWVTYADLYLLAGNTAIEFMGGPSIRFRPGRRDYTAEETDAKCLNDNGRMPKKHVNNDPFPHNRDTIWFLFERFAELGISLDNDCRALEKIVALMGGHNVGFMHPHVQGNEGTWTENPFVFGTEFFFNLDNGPWDNSTAEVVESTGALQYRGGPRPGFVMLPIDMVLRDRRMRHIVRKFSRNKRLFFKYFVEAWQQIQENGVDFA
eukprot:TRINITY_DN1567_c1_g1_i1.p2 TRINITY_DN1567_c1_g1~~TRINITY_DN1567_c1_g1_i1.p2  ORF type:complete len:359 (+),score=116.24 TRINITY_DN1567_c1_g1_i1:194-1270(+)